MLRAITGENRILADALVREVGAALGVFSVF